MRSGNGRNPGALAFRDCGLPDYHGWCRTRPHIPDPKALEATTLIIQEEQGKKSLLPKTLPWTSHFSGFVVTELWSMCRVSYRPRLLETGR